MSAAESKVFGRRLMDPIKTLTVTQYLSGRRGPELRQSVLPKGRKHVGNSEARTHGPMLGSCHREENHYVSFQSVRHVVCIAATQRKLGSNCPNTKTAMTVFNLFNILKYHSAYTMMSEKYLPYFVGHDGCL